MKFGQKASHFALASPTLFKPITFPPSSNGSHADHRNIQISPQRLVLHSWCVISLYHCIHSLRAVQVLIVINFVGERMRSLPTLLLQFPSSLRSRKTRLPRQNATQHPKDPKETPTSACQVSQTKHAYQYHPYPFLRRGRVQTATEVVLQSRDLKSTASAACSVIRTLKMP